MRLRYREGIPQGSVLQMSTDLILPLSGHHFCVFATNWDTGVEAGSVMSFDDISAEYLIGTHTAIVGALRPWETLLGPSQWLLVCAVQERVLLLNSEPGLCRCCLGHGVQTTSALIRWNWLLLIVYGLAQNQLIFVTTEWIIVESDWI